jgi:hypothetical protein
MQEACETILNIATNVNLIHIELFVVDDTDGEVAAYKQDKSEADN